MAVVARLFALLLGCLLGRRWGAAAAGLRIGLYTLVIGAGQAAVRATAMGGLAAPGDLPSVSPADRSGLPLRRSRAIPS